MLQIESFLTAYDPSDLPGGSIDPLGFERGYLLLAEKLLPGLTNVASRPRYFSALCAGIALSDAHGASSSEAPRERYARRLAATPRMERFWALACALASRKDEALDPAGIRGIRYVQRAMARMDERGESSTSGSYRLLSRQVPYGMVGIYGSVADGLGLIDRSTLSLGPDMGRRLGEGFVDETDMPKSLRVAIATDGEVGVAHLTKWGATAHIQANAGSVEARVLREALVANPIRARAAALLDAHPPAEGEHELLRLERVLKAMASTDDDADLRETLRTVVAYEHCYRGVLLVFQRLLWSCQRQEPFAVELSTATHDDVLMATLARLPAAIETLERALIEGQTTGFREGLDRLADVRKFLHGLAFVSDVETLVDRVLARHKDVQRAKLDGGRPKMPWLEVRHRKVVPTLSSAMRVARPPERSEDVLAHPYRTFAVDQFLALEAEKGEA